MAASSADKLQTFYIELQKNYQRGEYDKALKSANKILQQNASDDKAFHCKIVCLIQLSKFEEALTHIRKNAEAAKGLGFEKAYCEYRLNRISESYKTLNGLEQRSPAANELLAQVLYRMEEFEQCYQVYREQLKNTSDDYQAERETNLSAATAARQTWGDEELDEFGLSEDTYEVCYNSACFLLGKGLYQEAIDKLQQAEKLCLEFFEDDAEATEDDIEAELGVIRAQMGYADQKLGKNDAATKLYNQVLKQRPSDMALLAVVSNNIVTLNKDQNVFDSKKKIKAATVGGLQNKLVKRQREAIAMNQCLLFMYSNQGEQCRQTAQALQKTYPGNDAPCLIAAAQFVKDKQYEKATQVLQSQIAATSGDAFNLKMSLAQLYLSQAHVDKACEILKSLGDDSYAPGVVSALVSLYVNEEDTEAASNILHDAVKWHSQNNANSAELVRIMKATVEFEMRHGDPQTATTLLETLSKKDPSDLKLKAQLISAYSKFDPQKAEQVSHQLPSPGDMTKDIDSAALEMAVTSFVPKYAKKSALAKGEQSPSSPRSGGDEPLKKKHKKKKKGKLPKNHEPGSVPDSERWMPLRERSTYKGRRRKNKRDVGKGTQGAAAAAGLMAELDINKSSAEAQSPRAGSSTSQPQSAGPRQNKPQGAKPKKKKVPTATLR